jgi:5-methyltetrahydrofolate--homocysteine methyltransferase
VTESLAMLPAASVSGFYLGHPDASYFSVGRIGQDQVQNLATRRQLNQTELERLLAPNL